MQVAPESSTRGGRFAENGVSMQSIIPKLLVGITLSKASRVNGKHVGPRRLGEGASIANAMKHVSSLFVLFSAPSLYDCGIWSNTWVIIRHSVTALAQR